MSNYIENFNVVGRLIGVNLTINKKRESEGEIYKYIIKQFLGVIMDIAIATDAVLPYINNNKHVLYDTLYNAFQVIVSTEHCTVYNECRMYNVHVHCAI